MPHRSAPAVRTTCPYCGVGCGVVVRPGERGGVAVRGDPAHPANAGRLCSKGSALGETLDLAGRLLRPEIDGVPVEWNRALDAVASRLAQVLRSHGPQAIALYVSGQLLTEDYYVANKLAKGFLGTANIDSNSRLCMASSVTGHRRAFGSDTVPGIYEDLELADLVVLVGSNLAWCHPVLFERIVAARRQRPNLRTVVIDPRRTATAADADLHLALRPGTDAALFNGLLGHLARSGCHDRPFTERHTQGLAAALLGATARVREVAMACDLRVDDLNRFFRWFAQCERTVTVYSQGVNQSSCGTDKVNAIVNCHLLTARIGRPGMGPFSVTGQPNAMGGREVGALSNQLAAHMDFSPGDIDRVRRFWRAPSIAMRPGLKAVDMFRAMESGAIQAVWIMATNPAVSLPDAAQASRALAACPLVVVSDCVRETDTTLRAHIRLPALTWGEKDGTVTNSERYVSRQRRFLPQPGEARADWWMLAAVAHRLGFGGAFAYRSPAAIFREHAALSAFENGGRRDFDIGALAELDDAAYEALVPTRWPAPRGAAAPPARFFADGRFYAPDGRARFVAVTPRPPERVPDATYPLVLNTGRVRDQWHTMTRTGKVPRLWLHTLEPTVDVHPRDAQHWHLEDGHLARVDGRPGAMIARVRVTDSQRRGEVFAPMHWSERFARDARVNATVEAALDPLSGQPELKHAPVRLTPVPATWFGFALTRRPAAGDRPLYCSVAAGEGHWRYELAGDAATSAALVAEQFRPEGGGSPEWLEFRDLALGIHRQAWLVGGRLEACVFMARGPQLPGRQWLASLFTRARLTPAERATLLAGHAGREDAAAGPTVCACFGVSRGAIAAAAAAGAVSCERIGLDLKAGTNCGSCLPEIRRLLKALRPPAAPSPVGASGAAIHAGPRKAC